MQALYLYFTATDTQGRGSSWAPGHGRPLGDVVDEGPLIPIQPGAFSRWKANRDRVVAENAASLRSPVVARRGTYSPEASG